VLNEHEGVLLPFQHIDRLYQDSNLRRDERKDDSPFRYIVVGCEPTLASGRRFHGQRLHIKEAIKFSHKRILSNQ